MYALNCDVVVGGFNGDGVGVGGEYGVTHAAAASLSEVTLNHSSSVHYSWFGFLLPHGLVAISSSIASLIPSGQWGAPGLHRPGPIIRSCSSSA